MPLAVEGGAIGWLAENVEPYVSFRWLLAAVLSAMALQSLLATFLFLRDLMRPVRESSPREQQLGRLLATYGKLLVLRALSLETVRRHRGLIAQIVALAAAAVLLNVWVFSLEG